MDAADIIRVVLTIDITALALLAVFYLRRRRMTAVDYCVWAGIALLLPVFGPFFVIAQRPGDLHPDPFPSAVLREWLRQRASAFLWNLRAHPPLDVTRAAPPPRRRHPRRWI